MINGYLGTRKRGTKMKSFTHTIIDSLGIHARPAGQIVTEAKKFSSAIMIDTGEKKASATKLMAVMALGVKCGQSVTVTAEGEDEDAAIASMQQFFEANL